MTFNVLRKFELTLHPARERQRQCACQPLSNTYMAKSSGADVSEIVRISSL